MWSEEDSERFKRNAFKTCQDFLAGPWSEAELDDFRWEKVSGGLSNRLYHCSITNRRVTKADDDEKIPNEVLLRIYGHLRDQKADDYMESVVQDSLMYMQLADEQLGPKLYGVFSDGRLEEYIPSMILSSDNMRKMCRSNAREMAKIHSLQVPIRKNPDTFFQHCDRWLRNIEDHADLNQNMMIPAVKHIITSKILWTETEWLHGLVLHKDYPVVFCHNDLQGGNILLPTDAKHEKNGNRVFFIDFEFGYYNYRSFDIANHFVEWCFDYNTPNPPHFEYDLKKFPSRSEQETFIDVYLDQLEKEGRVFTDEVSKENEKRAILKEVELFKMFSHLYWAIWSLKLSFERSDGLNFEFMLYGETRFKIFNICKKEFLENVRNKNA